MNLIRWNPFAEMDNFFGPMAARGYGRFPRLFRGDDGDVTFEWAPSADISETDKEYLVRAELPGVKKEDLTVSLDNGLITIQGSRRQQREDKNEKFHTVECCYGNFSRTFSLPERVKADAIKSEFKDGILTVHIPRDEALSKPQRISVQ
jgi:HSP20 family protein